MGEMARNDREILRCAQNDRRKFTAGHSKPLVVNSSIRNWNINTQNN
jgi:hypothetical protein